MTRKYFGTDGIRGRANEFPMTADMALKVAQAAAVVLRGSSGKSKEKTGHVVIGKDPRLSSYMFEQALCAGFMAMGMKVTLTGPLPTPAIAHLTKSMHADLGVMISASHNPYHDNGIKLFGADGFKLADEVELAIEAQIDGDLSAALAAPENLGKAKRLDDAPGRYLEFIKASMASDVTFGGMKVVVDAAHGAAYKVAPQVLEEMGAQVIAIGNAPDGKNINAGFGATDTAALQQAVREQGADAGVALDGDADRLIMVDEKGEILDGDQIMASLAVSMKQADTLKGDTLVATVMSNLGMERYLESQGIKTLRAAVGDRYVMEEMKAGGYNLGGEQSGHVILSDYATTGDGLLAALQMLGILKQSGKTASEALRHFMPLPQILHNAKLEGGVVASGGAARILAADEVKAAIAKAEETLAESGRLLVRPSGTEPLIRVMAEGDDKAKVEEVVSGLCAVIEKAAGNA